MSPQDFEFISAIIRERSGLVLSKEKIYLLESRLAPITRSRGLKSVDELIAEVRNGAGEALIIDVVEAMTTNETYFFRDDSPFTEFRDFVVPTMYAARGGLKRLRIWCAACSTGQEPYSLAMILKDAPAKFDGWRNEIIATDLSNEALGKAKVGLYSQFEVQRGLPVLMLMKYFKQLNETWQIDSAIRAMVSFKNLNLLDRFDSLGVFDVVFCRNVLIYFDADTKRAVLDKIRERMPDDGILFMGGSETVVGISECFRRVEGHRGVYAPA